MAHTLTFKQTINTTPADVYRAFTSSTALRGWFSDVALADPRKGGRFYAGWNDGYYAAGEYVSCLPNKKVVFTWHGRGEPAPTRVQVAIAEKKGITTVTVTHSGIGSGKAWAKTAKEIGRGWEYAMRNLKSTLETGEDLRLTMRPMLGIMLGSALDANAAKLLSVPVTEGVLLDGIVEGMGAQAAGLRAGDVLVSLGGKKVSPTTLPLALQNRQAGDKVAVKYYRGPTLNTTTMELWKRPLPDMPATPAELSKRVGEMYIELDKELEKCFEGVTEAEASFKPSPTEWSAKDIICHLMVGERDGHSALAEIIEGIQRYYDAFGGNVSERHIALMAVFPTYRQLLDEYKRTEAETIALLAALPVQVVARKADWWLLCFNWLQPPLHNHGHFDNIRELIGKARAAQ